jgi:hypothetical protein
MDLLKLSLDPSIVLFEHKSSGKLLCRIFRNAWTGMSSIVAEAKDNVRNNKATDFEKDLLDGQLEMHVLETCPDYVLLRMMYVHKYYKTLSSLDASWYVSLPPSNIVKYHVRMKVGRMKKVLTGDMYWFVQLCTRGHKNIVTVAVFKKKYEANDWVASMYKDKSNIETMIYANNVETKFFMTQTRGLIYWT